MVIINEVVFIIEDLVRKAKDGDREAMNEIIERFNYFIIKQAAKYKIPSYDFEDLIQHGCLSVIRALDKLSNIEQKIIKDVYINRRTLKDAATLNGIGYRRAIEIRKEALKKLKDSLQ